MPANVISVKPGETITVVGVNAEPQPPLGIWGPTDPRPTHPIARPPGGWGGQQPPLGIWGPGFPYPDQGLPGNQPYPDQGLPGQQPRPDQGLPPFPSHPIVIPPTEPPPVQPPTDGDDGTWVWAWSPQAGRWVWVKVPGEGEAGPK